MPALRHRRAAIALTAVAAAAVLAGTVAAYWSVSGSGNGASVVGSTTNVTLAPGTTTGKLVPGGSADVAVAITNANPGGVHISVLDLDLLLGTKGFAVDASHTGCNLAALSFTTQTNGGQGWLLPKSSTTAVDLTGAVSLATSAQSACQGAQVTVYLKTDANPPPAPDTPLSVALTNGGGLEDAYVNVANDSSLSFNVVLPETSAASDTVQLEVDDTVKHKVIAEAPGITGGGTRTFTGVDATTLIDGTLLVYAWTSVGGSSSEKVRIAVQKDTNRPRPESVVTSRRGWSAGEMQLGDAMEFTFDEPILTTSVPARTTIEEINSLGNDVHDLNITGLTDGPVTLGGRYLANDHTSAAFERSTLTVSGPTVTATVAILCTGGSYGGDGCNALLAGSGALAFTPAPTVTDLAGNAATGTFTTASTFRAF